MKKVKKFLLIGIMFVVISALTGCGTETIDLNKYITTKTSGYNTKGKVSYTFDEDKLKEDYEKKIKIKSEDDASINWALTEGKSSKTKALLLSCIDVIMDKSENIKNGDKITLSWNCNDDLAKKYFGVKLKYSDIEKEVEGLKQISEFNPFAYLEVSFSGTSPNGSVFIKKSNEKKEMEDIDFTVNKQDGLKEGDTITITASTKSEDDFMEKFGEKLSKSKKEYTVKGLTRYITEINDIPEEKYTEIDNFLQDKLKSDLLRQNNRDFKDVELCRSYVLSSKEDNSVADNNYIYFIYKVTLHNNIANKDFNYYWYGCYKDVMVYSDGSCDIDLNSCNVPNASIWSSERINYAAGSYCYGVEDLDHFYKKYIEDKNDLYNCEPTIEEYH